MSATSTNHSHLYKQNKILDNQYDRRYNLLLELKKRRNDEVDKLRDITDIFDDSHDIVDEPVDATKYIRKTKNYGRRIMLSEWMSQVPSDLEEEWIFKICPVGHRNLIVAHNGWTRVYNKKNEVQAKFQSNLPGGKTNSQARHFTILDSVYRQKEKTYYILDILVWNSFSLLKCSSEFRFFFLKSKMEETPDLLCSFNKYNLINIEHYPATLPNVETQLSDNYVIHNLELPVDGVLFYHKNCTYMSGLTPLVGWLKPYMIPEKLLIPVNMSYMLTKPRDYISLEHYIDARKTKKARKNKTQDVCRVEEMET